MIYNKYLKRILDFTFSLLFFIILLPLFLIITLITVFINKGNPFFIQLRPGLNCTIFKLYKFKTMTDQKDIYNKLLPDDDRITTIGRFLRRTSLDELPQLINVIKGDMSLVGPRPLLIEYLDLYNEFQKRRHNVRPGITGWSQVNGRNLVSWTERFHDDIWYVDNISFTLDYKIILKTVVKVIKKEGISSSSSISMEKFKGNK